ncbi:hypothetical protein K503DRAFT_796908 [Rhizopogon vinicolor AM-OR11-026]|uniref:DEAD/DEAH-box helicase domain-containing protein n=1 Tax=Rhizopogon vinicolor AM-OR11-026 TaxID=1314800 RepID=A0A1B7NCZ0_9AGAM|nr:hypothetical protein K503DRAFT_796908 [Rhizopogon vinicolor AM-OR11-026]
MPHDTHNFQLEAISHLLDNDDMLLLTATGTGKTDTFIRTMHVIRYLTENHASAPEGVSFPHDPAMVIVCPTKALEEEMELKMRKAGLTAVAINEDTVTLFAARTCDMIFASSSERYSPALD